MGEKREKSIDIVYINIAKLHNYNFEIAFVFVKECTK